MASILKVDTIQDQSGNNIINESADTITIGASGDTITVPSGATISGALANTPAFFAYNDGSATQSISTATWTEATIYGVESFDTDSAFNTTTCRFTPQVAGKYFITASVYGPDLAANFNGILLSKNGSSDLNSSSNTGNLDITAIDFLSVNGIITLNGTTDYVSIFVNQQAGVSKNIGGSSGASISFFGGYKLIGA